MTTIKINPSIKREIAEKIILENSAGYSTEYQGSYYVIDGERVIYAQSNRPWDPWPDSAEVIGIDALVAEVGGANAEGVSFAREAGEADDDDAIQNAIDFALAYVPDEYDPAALSED